MASRPKHVLIISNEEKQRTKLQTLIEGSTSQNIEFKTQTITFKECMSHRINEPMVDLIIIGYDEVDHILHYLLRAIKENKILLFLSKKPTGQQKIGLKKHGVSAILTNPVDTDDFFWKVVEVIDPILYRKLNPD